MAHRLTVRAADQATNGDASIGWTRLEYRAGLNGPGGWALTIDADHPAAALLLEPGAGLAIDDDNSNRFGGPVAPAADGQGAYRLVETATQRLLTVTGVDDLACLWWRQTIPPAGATHSTATGSAAAAVAELVDLHLGTRADSDRSIPGWRVNAADAGDTVTVSGRWRPVGDVAAEVCNAHGLVMSATWEPGRVLFSVGEPSAVAFPFSVEDGTAAEIAAEHEAAKATVAYALGQGEGADRAVEVAGTAIGALRIEQALDRRDVDNIAQLAAAATAAVASSERTITVEAVDNQLTVGDTGLVRIGGVLTPITVAEVHVTLTPERTRRRVTLGTPPRSVVDRIVDAARRTITAT